MTGVRSMARAGGVPADVTSFVGRSGELGEVRRLLSAARLVTLTGVGGAGKTRLAMRVAVESRRAFPDGVWLVDLAPLQDGSLVEYAVAEALGVLDQTDRAITDVITERLRDRQLLLILDNCEHMLDDCAGLAAAWLPAARGLRILCTSRQPLGIPGEHVWTVPPLEVPDPDRPPPSDDGLPYAAAALFAERAAVADPDFALGPATTADVVRICRRLDGLPLAIELAAAQLRTLSITQLAEALEDRFPVLGARHTIPEHHRTLAATFDWSFELCSPAEQDLWRRMSVFVDSFELEAIEYVCRRADADDLAVLEAVIGLVDKSVLAREETAGRVRYRLLETIRQYGLARLRGHPGEELALRRRHRDWYVRLTDRFHRNWFGPDQVRWSARMRQELPNLRAAMSFSLGTAGEHRSGLAIAADLVSLWQSSGLLHEGRYWVERALAVDVVERARATDALSARARLAVLAAHSRIAMMQGRLGTAEAAAATCLAEARRLRDPGGTGLALHQLGVAAALTNDLARAVDLLEQAVAHYAEAGWTNADVVLARAAKATFLLLEGDVTGAARICAECDAVCAAHGDQWTRGYVLAAWAWIALAGGDFGGATEHLRTSVRLRQPLDDTLGMAASIERMAWAAAMAGKHERAGILLGAAHQLWQAVGHTLYGAKQWLRGHEECVSRTRMALGAVAYDRAFRRGTAMPEDEAIHFALGSDPPAAVASDAAAPVLTRRERQVAELVAQGLSNRDIAARLMVSQRTAESHVENILRKLGFTSRTRLAAWFSERQSGR